jgi:hypothetical protein
MRVIRHPEKTINGVSGARLQPACVRAAQQFPLQADAQMFRLLAPGGANTVGRHFRTGRETAFLFSCDKKGAPNEAPLMSVFFALPDYFIQPRLTPMYTNVAKPTKVRNTKSPPVICRSFFRRSACEARIRQKETSLR